MNLLLSRLAACLSVCTAALLAAGCAHRPPAEPSTALLHDELFTPPATPIDAGTVLALSDTMRAYADANLTAAATKSDVRQKLVKLLYSDGQLQLQYDAGGTRTAAQAFEARAGNCLSLVLMTASFAKYLGLPVSYQNIVIDDLYTRSGDLTLFNGHVNLVLGRSFRRVNYDPMTSRVVGEPDDLTVDFLPQPELRGQRHQPLQERTVLAMYMNNRAAETLAAGHVADSYWWAREALRQDPGFMTAANTLAVIYQRSGHIAQAETALRHVLLVEDDNTAALSNLSQLLHAGNRASEAAVVDQRLARLQPYAPFHFYDLGRQAMQRADFQDARQLFEHELERQPFNPELHFWAAQAAWRLDDNARAARHMSMAAQYSSNRGTQQLYAAKLDLLRAQALH